MRTGLVIGSVPAERAGSAASMSETGNYLGGSLGLGLMGAAAAVAYRAHTHGTSDSLASALAASSHQPPAQAAATLHTARAAFTASLHVTGVVAAVVFGALAVLVVVMRPAEPLPEEAGRSVWRIRSGRISCSGAGRGTPLRSVRMGHFSRPFAKL